MKNVVLVLAMMFATVSVYAVNIGDAVPGRPGIVYAATDGSLIRPAPGYTWTDDSKTAVKWTPGIRHTNHPNVIASSKKENWNPAPGYRWANDRPGDFTVIRNTVRVTCPRCAGSKFERCDRCGSTLGTIGKIKCTACRGTGMFNGWDCICMGGTQDCSSCIMTIGVRDSCKRCNGNGYIEQ